MLCPACARCHEHVRTNHLAAPTVQTLGDCSMGTCRGPSSSGSSPGSRRASFSGASRLTGARAYAGAGQAVPGATPKARIDAQAAVMAVRTSILLTWRALLTAAFLAVTAVLLGLGPDDRHPGPALARRNPPRRRPCHGMGHLVRRPRPRRRRADAEPASPRTSGCGRPPRPKPAAVLCRGAGGHPLGRSSTAASCVAEREVSPTPLLSLSAPSFAQADCRTLSGAAKFAAARVPPPSPGPCSAYARDRG